MRSRYSSFIPGLTCAVAIALLATACGGAGSSSKASTAPVTVRLGYFPNLTHATAIVGVEDGLFQKALGPDKLELSTFTAGPAAVEALFSGALDATYIGPNPTLNAYQMSNGTAVRIISGATSGGAALVVKPSINSAADLKGKKLATPQLGNTQDVALRTWLKQNGLKTDTSGGGDVSILPQDNATALSAFESGAIDGAWVPEPYATRMVQEGGAKVLVDERSLWPNGQFATTQLIVRTAFLKAHPDAVKRLLEGQVEANDLVNSNPAQAQQLVNQGLTKLTGKGISDGVMQAAWKNLTFTNDPIASSLATSAQHATAVGLLSNFDQADLRSVYDLSLLNQVLSAANKPAVQA